MNEVRSYPVYRKYTGINVWFKILSDRQFEEIKQIGTKFTKHTVVAEQYPEMVLIQDMLNCHEDRWEPIAGEVYEEMAKKA